MAAKKIKGILLTEITYNLFETLLEIKYAFTGKVGDSGRGAITHGFSKTNTWSTETEKKFREFLNSAVADIERQHGLREEKEDGAENVSEPRGATQL